MNCINRIHSIKIVIILICFSTVFNSDATESIVDEKVVVKQIISQLNQHYVFPKIAKEAENLLSKNLVDKRYQGYNTANLLAIKLTSDLQRVTQDKHIRVRISSPTIDNKNEKSSLAKEANLGFKAAEIIKGNIGYLVFDSFSADPAAITIIKNAFKQFKNVDGLIFDLRNNTGGSPEFVQTIGSYLFENKTQLSSIYWRESDKTVDYWTSGKPPFLSLARVPLFILTSPKTFSAAEAFSYDLQKNNRAILIGETTKGGANPGRSFALNDYIDIFIPTGTAINPITKTNWERTGVVPDHEINQLFAFDLAHELATNAAVKYRVKYGKASTKEKYQKTNTAPVFGSWRLAKNGCPLKLSLASPQYNETTGKYQTPYRIKYYGNGALRIKFKLGTKNSRHQQNLYFKSRQDEKSGISTGFTQPDTLSITQCQF